MDAVFCVLLIYTACRIIEATALWIRKHLWNSRIRNKQIQRKQNWKESQLNLPRMHLQSFGTSAGTIGTVLLRYFNLAILNATTYHYTQLPLAATEWVRLWLSCGIFIALILVLIFSFHKKLRDLKSASKMLTGWHCKASLRYAFLNKSPWCPCLLPTFARSFTIRLIAVSSALASTPSVWYKPFGSWESKPFLGNDPWSFVPWSSHLLIGILIMGPYKPLLLGWWVYPLLYGNNGSLDPGTYQLITLPRNCRF